MNILLIDDDKNLATITKYQLEKQGYLVEVAYSGEEGIQRFKEKKFHFVLSDIEMGNMSGLDVVRNIRERDPDIPVVLITAYGTVDNAVTASRIGADDYLIKPFTKEQLIFVIEKVSKLKELKRENLQLKLELNKQFDFEQVVSKSEKMNHVIELVKQVCLSDSTVLLQGPSGTGKSLFAKLIHYNSTRKEKPFITVNCPSIPDQLLESELFGHVKGSFTGAIRDKKGKFELADGGTIFLDEIGDLAPHLQAKLLRVIQERIIERVGGTTPTEVDVRIIAATNKNLLELVEEGTFREDLYYRLSVFPITFPPLKERKEDIPHLVKQIINRIKEGNNVKCSDAFLKMLENYNWPGNIRELENTIERAMILCKSNILDIDCLPQNIINRPRNKSESGARVWERDKDTKSAEILSLEEIEKRTIIQAIQTANGNKSEAARLLGIPRHKLLYKLKLLHIDL
ncbi:MAG: sigma-54 dependent transcriptional regulator [Calditrichia bacterium]